ncbi:zinc finger protein 511-like isoform X2 [Limulus polyphemus]|uniref:Zinc finger protein 511-like isoform X2 n=1 Tax=Limulus polyphemus TaxID=6850 RepID=A0ABM1BK08_LIMPO|nr:zinc finger protein 511-like isoform X2 [Limulus polyphemus]
MDENIVYLEDGTKYESSISSCFIISNQILSPLPDDVQQKIASFIPPLGRLPPWDPYFQENTITGRDSRKQCMLELDKEEFLHKSYKEFRCGEGGCQANFNNIQSYESHYNSIHRHVCSKCKKSFPSDHLLSIHITEVHSSFFLSAAKKSGEPIYECLVEGCVLKFMESQARKEHLIKEHKYPADFRFSTFKQKITKSNTQDAMETDEVCHKVKDIHNRNKSSKVNKPGVEEPNKLQIRVPKTICFGYGSPRGFHRGAPQYRGKGKTKHWHQTSETGKSITNVEDISMQDLEKALDDGRK